MYLNTSDKTLRKKTLVLDMSRLLAATVTALAADPHPRHFAVPLTPALMPSLLVCWRSRVSRSTRGHAWIGEKFRVFSIDHSPWQLTLRAVDGEEDGGCPQVPQAIVSSLVKVFEK